VAYCEDSTYSVQSAVFIVIRTI